MKRCVILYGPTAVGKTDISLQLAHTINAEIINMDVGQFYAPLTIGTAKPNWKCSDVPHHFFDILDKPRNFSVVEYREKIYKIIKNIWDRGKMPLIVGGSGFYLHALLFKHNQKLEVEHVQKSDDNIEISWDVLHKIDPVRAKNIHPHDQYRIKRAIELFKKNGIQPSYLQPQFEPLSDAHIIFLERERSELYNRIIDRITLMFQDGFKEEVHQLLDTPWESFLLQKKLIGYNELIHYFHIKDIEKNNNIDTIQHIIAQRTKQYAKRQHTFWRYLYKILFEKMQVQNIISAATINMTQKNEHTIMKQIIEHIKN